MNYSTNISMLQRFLDLSLSITALILIAHVYGIPFSTSYLILGVLGSGLFVLLSELFGLYKNSQTSTLISIASLIFNGWVVAWFILIVLMFLLKESENFSRVVLTLWGLTVPFFLISYRWLIRVSLRQYFYQSANYKMVAIIGVTRSGRELAKVINDNPWLGYKVAGFFDDEYKGNEFQMLGELKDLEQACNKNSFAEIYICLPLKAESEIQQLLNLLSNSTLVVKFIPDLFSFDLLQARWTDLKGLPVISVYDSPLNSNLAKIIKRLEDIILSVCILVLISPILVVLALGVKLTSQGPIIFKQKRYGINGKEINIYKFRSMISQDNGDVILQATQNDARVTRFGAFMRKTSLDELPQFINVLQGKMSIVGPRPHASAHNEHYRKIVPKYMQRHSVKPGITGWAQVNGWRGETKTLDKMEKRIEFDLYYINNWSLLMDLKIIFLTLVKGFFDKNAY
ncbi:undecaprenyl-phosphate glucose phosphotransferase [Thiosulfativibrio zosterae]|uniref:Undecaprenyl-phosphate glucose phosphotransferase n=1 Tax=Thiosulfativibrio zosterae TaxID=2675053 RepID=A0A6F8PQL3_9GAMM|nr:undecaprenyl-phosphate glucose phosphotransferase [Thiosulfativibrio zosterae]BBP44318.1 undecaprenyl-phosphate glucose phosphotransferase [Thiosulfativibrio zosterae]